jgi:hypothetical protein
MTVKQRYILSVENQIQPVSKMKMVSVFFWALTFKKRGRDPSYWQQK